MNKKIVALMLGAVLFCSGMAAEKKVDSTLIVLKGEIEALKRLRAEKLDKVEALEAARWNARYRHNEEMKLKESQVRELDSRYSSLAAQLNRKQEDILLLKNALDDEQAKLETSENMFDNFILQVRQAIEESGEKIALDFPVGIAENTAVISKLSASTRENNPEMAQVLSSYIGLRLNRIAMTRQQELSTRAALFGDGKERIVWRLRLGTVFMVDIDKDGSAYQLLMHNGALQGQRYMWKNRVGETFQQDATALLAAAQEGTTVPVPLDVLQNGKVGITDELTESNDTVAKFKLWFSRGGIIMYPLFFCAILAFLLSIERLVTLTARHHRYRKSYRNLLPLISKNNWNGAMRYCEKRGSGLARAIQEIVNRRDGARTQAEQHVKQILLGEVPALEKRMSLISALGASAPLLGLYGTVNGMVDTFTTITLYGNSNPVLLADGISEALLTTQSGLLIAFPLLLLRNMIDDRIVFIRKQLQKLGMSAIALLESSDE